MRTIAWMRHGLSALLLVWLAACDTSSPEEHLESARQMVAEHDLRSATIELKNAISKQEGLAEAHLLLGQVRYELNEFPDALLEFTAALDSGLDTDEVRAGLLLSKVRVGRYGPFLSRGESRVSVPDQMAPDESHLRGGETGKWRRFFDESDKAFAANQLSRFGVSLGDFELG